MITSSHHYFLLPVSPWPALTSIQSFSLLLSLMLFLKFSICLNFTFSTFLIALSCFYWWLGYSGEMNLEGKSSLILESGVKSGMILFISSEVFFFFSFFWAYFHFFLSPSFEVGLSFPPLGVLGFDCLNVPMINTLVLMASGVTVTISHNFLISSSQSKSSLFLFLTVVLGLIFTFLQGQEYSSSFFSLSDSSFGTSFFLLTGFHGLHVLIGTLFLTAVLYRFFKFSGSGENFLSFELSSWYWHFVDVVWIFLYFFIYYLNQ